MRKVGNSLFAPLTVPDNLRGLDVLAASWSFVYIVIVVLGIQFPNMAISSPFSRAAEP